MRLVAVLVVLIAVAWLGARALSATESAGPSAAQGQSIVDGARGQLDAAQATRSPSGEPSGTTP